ncbi:hypothetical protein GCM10027290_51310 [Micromonospora sonneratiae]|uniref:Uncharacterized protein n=1 Tax=Micromonospora sonneratiae TaxID=1184706 RepID=A0ABW3YDH4_9ACTN
MNGAQLTELFEHGMPGVREALDLVAGFDDSLVPGFARLSEEHASSLAALAAAVGITPLGERVSEAVEKIVAGSVTDERLSMLAGARAALLGAVHDALLAGFDAASGRTRAVWEPSPATSVTGGSDNLLAGCRSWLSEVALAGWRGVDHDLVAASGQMLEALLAAPDHRRLAVLVDGLTAELRASCPVGTMPQLPVRRWADLWTRALLLSQPGGWAGRSGAVTPVSGRLLILGVDVHEHSTAVQIQVHGILEPAGGEPARLVRASVAAAKVDTIVGPALWRLLSGYPVLLGALAERRSVTITDMSLHSSGDLVWREEQARPDEPADPFTTARVQLAGALAPPVPPLDRHTVRIAEPVLVEGYRVTTVGDDPATIGFDLGGSSLAVDVDRLPGCGPLTSELVAASTACLGLIRWDGGRWSLQPMAVQATVKRKPVVVHTGDWALGPTDPKVVKAEAKAGDAVAVLRERAGRLLRK